MHFPGIPTDEKNCDVYKFNANSTANTAQNQLWLRPPGRAMVYIALWGGGGAGGNGFSAAAAAARGGGGGGGSSGQGTVLVPSFGLPDALHVQIGHGGRLAGSAGFESAITIAGRPSNAALNTVMRTLGGGAGGNGTGAAAGAAGAGGAGTLITNCILAGLGNPLFLAGMLGATGGAQTGAAGVNINYPATGLRVIGGAGGAGTTSANFAGGAVTAATDAYFNEWIAPPSAAGSNAGSAGAQHINPFFSLGANGGSSSNTGVGGAGGRGAIGSGGGGGGGGTTGGLGGEGGDGYGLIICF